MQQIKKTWRNLVIVFVLIFLAMLGYYVYLFRQVQTVAARAVANLPATDSARLNEEQLERALKLLADKEQNFARLLVEPPTIIDPSR